MSLAAIGRQATATTRRLGRRIEKKSNSPSTRLSRRRYESLAPLRPFSTSSIVGSSEESHVAPKSFRYPIAWKDPDYLNEEMLEFETRRVFDVCHGCRLCYSLCDSFPRLFDLIDESKTGELDSVPSSAFKPVADACTLCDICFMNKCPYTPPHGLNVDFPHLILRLKALDQKQQNTQGVTLATPTTYASVKESSGTKAMGGSGTRSSSGGEHVSSGSSSLGSGSLGSGSVHVLKDVSRKLETQPESPMHALYANLDLVGPIGSMFSPMVNWMTRVESNEIVRSLMESIFGINRRAELPTFVAPSKTLVKSAKKNPYKVDKSRKAYSEGRKVVLYATCNGNYNKPNAANAFRAILARHGVICQVEYEGCCGMPQLESGRVKDVASKAKVVAAKLKRLLDEGFEVVTPVSSCTLMFKKEWPLLEPDDANIALLASKTYDMSEYLVKLKKEKVLDEIPPLSGESVTLHHACHTRAQNMGFKSQALLESIPNLHIASVERCSGHGGSFGVQTEGHHIAMKVGKPVFKKVIDNIKDEHEALLESLKQTSTSSSNTSSQSQPTSSPPIGHTQASNYNGQKKSHFVSSDCPLAMDHILQGVQAIMTKEKDTDLPAKPIGAHPVELVAKAYRIQL